MFESRTIADFSTLSCTDWRLLRLERVVVLFTGKGEIHLGLWQKCDTKGISENLYFQMVLLLFKCKLVNFNMKLDSK